MPTTEPELLLGGLAFPEGPRWHDGRLWFSDMHMNRVMAVSEDGASETIVEVPGRPSGLGWLPDGTLLVVSMRDRRLMKFTGGALTVFADLSELVTGDTNDMVTDARGNSYVGNFGFDLHAREQFAPANLVRVTPSGEASVVAEDLGFPNGTVITPDGRTLIVGESFSRRLTAFDIQPDGGLANRRVFAETGDAVPDGICLDAEGAVWIASPSTQEAVRIRQGGEVAARVSTAPHGCFACMLGGAGGRTLFLLTAPGSDPDDVRRQMAGAIRTVRVEVPHAGWP